MKIIREGNPPKDHNVKAECVHCRCVFEFTQLEATRVQDAREGDFWRIPCPWCHKDVATACNR